MLTKVFEEYSEALKKENFESVEGLYSSDGWHELISELAHRKVKIKQFEEEDPKGFGAVQKNGYRHIMPFRKFVVFFENIGWDTQTANNITSHVIFELENERAAIRDELKED